MHVSRARVRITQKFVYLRLRVSVWLIVQYLGVMVVKWQGSGDEDENRHVS